MTLTTFELVLVKLASFLAFKRMITSKSIKSHKYDNLLGKYELRRTVQKNCRKYQRKPGNLGNYIEKLWLIPSKKTALVKKSYISLRQLSRSLLEEVTVCRILLYKLEYLAVTWTSNAYKVTINYKR